MKKKKSSRHIQFERMAMDAKRTAHKAMKIQRQIEKEQHIEDVKAKRASIRKYYREHPEARPGGGGKSR